MSDYNQDKLTADVVAAFAKTPDPRLREIMQALVRHLHAFAREVDLTPDEWLAGHPLPHRDRPDLDRQAPRVHPAVGHAGPVDDDRLAGPGRASGARGATEPTEATVEGPFYWPGAPDLPLGTDIGEGVPGEPTLYTGRVTDCDGKPLAGALLDVWSGDGDGKYDVQLADRRRR